MRIKFQAKVEGVIGRETGGYTVKVAAPAIVSPFIGRDDKQGMVTCVAALDIADSLKLGQVFDFEGDLVSLERPPKAGSNFTRGIANLTVFLTSAKGVAKSA